MRNIDKKSRARILVVEDDIAILNGLLDVLVFNGYEASGVEDGGKGLEKALAENFDLIILDVMLPTLDGFSVCREIRNKTRDSRRREGGTQEVKNQGHAMWPFLITHVSATGSRSSAVLPDS